MFKLKLSRRKQAVRSTPTVTDPLPREEEIEKSLHVIYRDRGRSPEWSRLERHRSHRWLARIVGAVIFCGLAFVAARAGFALFQPFREFSGQGLRLTVEGPTDITLGREETFVIRWWNQDEKDLEYADIRVSLPPDFVVTSLIPAPTHAGLRLWDFGLVAAGQEDMITIKGVFTGALGSRSALQILGTYRPAGFSREYQSLATQAVRYTASVLQARLDLPEKVFVGDSVPVRFRILNQGSAVMPQLIAHMQLPSGFLSAGATGTASQAREVFLPVGDLKAGASTTVALVGSFVSGVSGDVVFDAEIGTTGTNGFIPLQKTEAHLPVLSGDLTIHLVVNGSDASRTILPAEPLHLTLGYQNTSPETLKNVSLRVSFESIVNGKSATGTSLLDWRKLDDPSQGASTTRPRIQTLGYDKKILPAFAELLPQSDGTVEIALPALSVTTGTKDALIRVTAEAWMPIVGASKVNRHVAVAPIELRYRSDADVAIEARYFTEEGAPIGFGPLPPVAGKSTGYRIFWRITKSLHALDHVTVSAVLPKMTDWEAKAMASVGNITFTSSTRTVLWQIDRVSEQTNVIEASFDVQVTPDDLDVGRFADLLGKTNFTGQDTLVGEMMTRAIGALTTDLSTDEGARAKGVVRKP